MSNFNSMSLNDKLFESIAKKSFSQSLPQYQLQLA